MPGARDAELGGDAVLEVLAAAQRRQPHDAGAEPERDLDRGRVHAADLAVAADPAEHGDRVADVSLHGPGERGGGGVVRLQHDGPVPGGGRFVCGLERVDRARAVRVGAEVAVQIGGPGEVDAHQRRA